MSIAKYVTCPKGHKVFVIWAPDKMRFAFTCEECAQHSFTATSTMGVIEIILRTKPLEPWKN